MSENIFDAGVYRVFKVHLVIFFIFMVHPEVLPRLCLFTDNRSEFRKKLFGEVTMFFFFWKNRGKYMNNLEFTLIRLLNDAR